MKTLSISRRASPDLGSKNKPRFSSLSAPKRRGNRALTKIPAGGAPLSFHLFVLRPVPKKHGVGGV